MHVILHATNCLGDPAESSAGSTQVAVEIRTPRRFDQRLTIKGAEDDVIVKAVIS
jgi:hypothetical protein